MRAMEDERVNDELTQIFKMGATNRKDSLRSWVAAELLVQYSTNNNRKDRKPYHSSEFFSLLMDAWSTDEEGFNESAFVLVFNRAAQGFDNKKLKANP